MGKLFSFEGRRVAVTGGRGGLGSALVAELENLGAKAIPVSREMTWDPAQFDVVILNAGFGLLQRSDRILLQECREMFRVNTLDTLEKAQIALSARSLHVHVVGSVLSLVSAPHLAVYAATKYALRGWAYGAARELPGRVSISYPNGMKTRFFDSLQGDRELLTTYKTSVSAAESNYDRPETVAQGILSGIEHGAREIIPSRFTLDWFRKNEEDIRRMWYPGLTEPSVEKFDWWESVRTYFANLANRTS